MKCTYFSTAKRKFMKLGTKNMFFISVSETLTPCHKNVPTHRVLLSSLIQLLAFCSYFPLCK